jgi:hypothetical protein
MAPLLKKCMYSRIRIRIRIHHFKGLLTTKLSSIIIKRGATEELDNQAKNTLNTSPGMGLYKETVKQRMEEYMKTYQAVADFLGESRECRDRRDTCRD